MIRLGCSGWSYPDWVGPFYPNSKTDKLAYYTRQFNTVEINTTFYNIPPEKMVQKWIRAVRDSDFLFSIKFPGSVTHDLLLENTSLALEKAAEFQNSHILPFLEKRKLASVLLQLPPSFSFDHMEKLTALLDVLDTENIPYFVEPRHTSIYENSVFLSSVESSGAGVVDLDGPMRKLTGLKSPHRSVYLRLHGRNHEAWSRKNESPSERYNYFYSEQEIASFSDIIKKVEGKYEDIYIYFNNHPSGSAPANASSLATFLGLKSRDPQRKLI